MVAKVYGFIDSSKPLSEGERAALVGATVRPREDTDSERASEL